MKRAKSKTQTLLVALAVLLLGSWACYQGSGTGTSEEQSTSSDDDYLSDISSDYSAPEGSVDDGYDDSGDDFDAKAEEIEEGWDEVRQMDDPQAMEAKANDLLRKTRELADSSDGN
jgi:hypothetical protein